jgi:hypothetical protein
MGKGRRVKRQYGWPEGRVVVLLQDLTPSFHDKLFLLQGIYANPSFMVFILIRSPVQWKGSLQDGPFGRGTHSLDVALHETRGHIFF